MKNSDDNEAERNHKVSVPHKRYEEIPVKSCNGNCPQEEGTMLKIILFEKDENLRSHAVKHLMNPLELQAIWKNMLSTDATSIHQRSMDMFLIGCPFFEPGYSYKSPPCKGCKSFHKCTGIVADLENDYLNIIRKIIKEGVNIPRYACYFSREKQICLFCTMPEQNVVAKAALYEDDIYNLMTCYSTKMKMPTQRMRNKQIQKIRNEASKQSITWCRESTWGIR